MGINYSKTKHRGINDNWEDSETNIALLAKDVENNTKEIAEIKEKYVTKEQLTSYKNEVAPYILIVKGLVTIILTAVVVAIVALVVK